MVYVVTDDYESSEVFDTKKEAEGGVNNSIANGVDIDTIRVFKGKELRVVPASNATIED